MPKFIKTNMIVEVNRHGVESDRQVLFTDDEVIARVRLNPSLVIDVTESHASQVVRSQGKYQELSEELLERIDSGAGVESTQDYVPSKDANPNKAEVEPEPEVVKEDGGGTLSFGKGK